MEDRKIDMVRIVRGVLVTLLMAVLVVALLAVANGIPSRAQGGFAKRFSSVEEAQRAIGLDRIAVPAYFPAGISWPPSFIIGQQKPYRAVAMEFREAQTGRVILTIVQSSLRQDDPQFQRIRMTAVREETAYSLKGKTAVLQVGTCGGGIACGKMTWQDKGAYTTVLSISSPFDLIRIAESMIH